MLYGCQSIIGFVYGTNRWWNPSSCLWHHETSSSTPPSNSPHNPHRSGKDYFFFLTRTQVEPNFGRFGLLFWFHFTSKIGLFLALMNTTEPSRGTLLLPSLKHPLNRGLPISIFYNILMGTWPLLAICQTLGCIFWWHSADCYILMIKIVNGRDSTLYHVSFGWLARSFGLAILRPIDRVVEKENFFDTQFISSALHSAIQCVSILDVFCEKDFKDECVRCFT